MQKKGAQTFAPPSHRNFKRRFCFERPCFAFRLRHWRRAVNAGANRARKQGEAAGCGNRTRLKRELCYNPPRLYRAIHDRCRVVHKVELNHGVRGRVGGGINEAGEARTEVAECGASPVPIEDTGQVYP